MPDLSAGASAISFRPYQERAITEARRRVAAGVRRILIQAATGAGKTVVGAGIVQFAIKKGKRVLFLAHRRELIDQTVDKLVAAGVLNFGVIMAGKPLYNWDAPVQVASIQTLIRREFPPADIVMIDECHRAQSRSYLSVLANYPDSVVIGLTATPERLDGKGLDDIFEDMVVVEKLSALIAQGYLVEPTCYAGETADLSGIKKRLGDYDEHELGEAMDTPKLVGDIIANWQRYANHRQTVVFAVTIDHAEHIATEFMQAGISAAALSGKTPKAKRESIITDWKAGHIQVVANCMVLTEGFDYPDLSACILARPTKSLSLYLQMVGRVMRSAPGKTSAIVLDHAGCIKEHGHPNFDHEWALEGMRVRKKQSDAPDVAVCDNCSMQYQPEPKLYLADTQEQIREAYRAKAISIVQGAKKGRAMDACPGCGHAKCLLCLETFNPKPIRRDIDGIAHETIALCPTCGAQYSEDVPHLEIEAEEQKLPGTTNAILGLVGADETPIKVVVLNEYKRLINEARKTGKKRGWAWHRLSEKYDQATLRECLPRHTGEWWRQSA